MNESRRSYNKAALPPGWTLHGLPGSIVLEFQQLAKKVITKRFVPVVWLKVALRRRSNLNRSSTRQGSKGQTKEPVVQGIALLQSSPLLRQWPVQLLGELAEKIIWKSFEYGDIITHLGEPAVGGVRFIASGMCELLVPGDQTEQYDWSPSRKEVQAPRHSYMSQFLGYNSQREKSKGMSKCVSLKMISAPAVLADFSVLNEEPYLWFCVASNDTAVATIPRNDFVAMFQKLPVGIAQSIVSDAYTQRARNLPFTFPMTNGRLRVSRLFRDFPHNGISIVFSKLRPRFYPRGEVICEKDHFTNEIFFLRRGLVGFKDEGGRRVIMRDGACFGERELCFRERFQFKIVAMTNVDMYILKDADLQVIKSNDTYKALLNEAASEQRETDLAATGANLVGSTKLDEFVRAIPLLNYFAPQELFDELRSMLTPRVFNSRQLIVSRADPCDKLLILTRGVAQIRAAIPTANPFYLQIGECIGYTCLADHSWDKSVWSVEPCDVWELDRRLYIKLLRKYAIYHLVLGATEHLLQPLYPFPHRCDALGSTIFAIPNPNSFPHLKTPNMHPIVNEDQHLVYPPWRDFSVNDDAVFGGRRGKDMHFKRKKMRTHPKVVDSLFVTVKDMPPPASPRKGEEKEEKEQDQSPTRTSSQVQSLLHEFQTMEPAGSVKSVVVDPLGNLVSHSFSFGADGKEAALFAAASSEDSNELALAHSRQEKSVRETSAEGVNEGAAPAEGEMSGDRLAETLRSISMKASSFSASCSSPPFPRPPSGHRRQSTPISCVSSPKKKPSTLTETQMCPTSPKTPRASKVVIPVARRHAAKSRFTLANCSPSNFWSASKTYGSLLGKMQDYTRPLSSVSAAPPGSTPVPPRRWGDCSVSSAASPQKKSPSKNLHIENMTKQ